MKKFAPVALMAVVALITLAATPSRAQILIKADVPFDFCAGYGTLPAGEYKIAPTSNASALTLSSGQRGVEIMLPRTTDWRDLRQSPKLVFHRYGDEYFLSEIWSTDGAVRTLAVHPRERKLARNGMVPLTAVVYGVAATRSGN